MDEKVRWEGELITGGRKGDPVKARIVEQQGAWLDEISQIGDGLKLQVWDPKNGEWRRRSPHEINAVSFAVALVASYRAAPTP